MGTNLAKQQGRNPPPVPDQGLGIIVDLVGGFLVEVPPNQRPLAQSQRELVAASQKGGRATPMGVQVPAALDCQSMCTRTIKAGLRAGVPALVAVVEARLA